MSILAFLWTSNISLVTVKTVEVFRLRLRYNEVTVTNRELNVNKPRNERIKGTASLLIKLSSASILVGMFMPTCAWLFELPAVKSPGLLVLGLSGALWVGVGAILFVLAMRLLREVR